MNLSQTYKQLHVDLSRFFCTWAYDERRISAVRAVREGNLLAGDVHTITTILRDIIGKSWSWAQRDNAQELIARTELLYRRQLEGASNVDGHR